MQFKGIFIFLSKAYVIISYGLFYAFLEK